MQDESMKYSGAATRKRCLESASLRLKERRVSAPLSSAPLVQDMLEITLFNPLNKASTWVIFLHVTDEETEAYRYRGT